MITLNKMATEVIRTLSGGDQAAESRIQRREVVLRLRQSLNQLLKVELLNHRAEGTRLPIAQYVATYAGIEVQEEGDQKYISLPEGYLGLPYNKGIYAVYPDKRPKSLMIRRNNPYISNKLDCKYLEGQEGYWTEGHTLFFDDEDMSHKKITVKLVIAAPDSFGKDDILPILPEQQLDAVRMVIEDMVLQKTVPTDEVNDADDIEIAVQK